MCRRGHEPDRIAMVQRDEESEIKLRLTEDEIARLRPRLGEPVTRLRQENYFYETAEDHLSRKRVSLRVREEFSMGQEDAARSILLTVKEAGVRAGALMVRPEVECDLDRPAWEELRRGDRRFQDLDLSPILRLKEIVPGFEELELALLGTFETERDVFSFTPPKVRTRSGTHLWAEGMVLEILLDKSFFPGDTVEWELETELPQADAGRGARILRALFEEVGIDWRPSEHGKYIRLRRKIGRAVEEDA